MMRRATSARILLLLGLEALGTAGALALDGTLTVRIQEARAFKEDTDGLIGSEQDFWVCGALDNGPVSLWAPEKGDRDHESWNPAATRSKTVPGMNQRFFDFYFELWDADTFGNNTAFDISPQFGPNPPANPCLNWLFQTGGFPRVTYDVCTGRMFVNGVNGSNPIAVGGANFAELNGAGTTNGNQDTWGALRFDVAKEPSNWLPDEVYRASKAVAAGPLGIAPRKIMLGEHPHLFV